MWFIQWNNWSQIYNNIIVCVKNAELRYCHEINVARQQQSDFKTNIKRCPWPDPVRIISVILAGNVVKVFQKASLTVMPLPGQARHHLRAMWLNLDQRFKICRNTFWQFWIAYIYLSLSPAHRSKILISFFLYCLPWRYCGMGVRWCVLHSYSGSLSFWISLTTEF